MTAAVEAGSRALIYFVQAGAYDRLSGFASALVTSTTDPRLLTDLLPHLQAAAESATEGQPRCKSLCRLADALRHAGRPGAALPFYEQAASEARSAAQSTHGDQRKAWSSVAWISGNWAHALYGTGDLDASRQRRLESAEAKRRAGRHEIDVIGSELEALRLDIVQGKAAEALAEVEERLAKVKALWEQYRAGQPMPEGVNVEVLARTFFGALDIAHSAHRALDDWESALRRTESELEAMLALRRSTEEIAGTRLNRGVALGQLGRFEEATAELEACHHIFQNDPDRRSKVLGALAHLFHRQGDTAQAIFQTRRSLALREQLPNPARRADAHNNLAQYLYDGGSASNRGEADHHQLAALAYRVVSGPYSDLQASLLNYARSFRRAEAAASSATIPRVSELLADPAFQPLADWLRQRKVDPAEVQGEVDRLLEVARNVAMDEQASDPTP